MISKKNSLTCLNSIDPLPCKLGNVLSKEELKLRKKFIDIGSSNTASESSDGRLMVADTIKTDSPEQALGDNDAGVHKSWLQLWLEQANKEFADKGGCSGCGNKLIAVHKLPCPTYEKDPY
jgi:hypothetical protein